MVPLFHPRHATAENPAGEPEAAPRFRGQWETAREEEHRHPFSQSKHYDPTNQKYDFENLVPGSPAPREGSVLDF